MKNASCDQSADKKKFVTFRNLPICKFEIMLLGAAAVGKTALLNRLIMDKTPIVSEPTATAGAEFLTKSIRLSDVMITFKIWDCSGQDRELLRTYYANCDAVIIVYDITNQQSFYEAQKWVTEIRERDLKNKIIAMVGNKVDLNRNRMVSLSEAVNFTADNNLIFMETSAVSALNVEYCFEELAKKLYDRKQENEQKRERINSVVHPTCCIYPRLGCKKRKRRKARKFLQKTYEHWLEEIEI